MDKPGSFNLAMLWNEANQEYDEKMGFILNHYCSELHDRVEHKECCVMHNKLYIEFEDSSKDLWLELSKDGMVYYTEFSGPNEIPCEYTLPTIDEVIEELGLVKKNEQSKNFV